MGDPITIGLMVASTVMKAVGQRNAGIAAQQQANAQADLARRTAEYEAQQLERQAGQERAVSQRVAIEKRRESVLAVSRAKAVSAADGGGSFDPTVVNLISNLEAEGDQNVMTTMWEGESAGQILEQRATLRRYSGNYSADILEAGGRNQKRAGYNSAFSTILGGSSDLYTKYG